MDNLRWLLLVIGLIIIAGIYLAERFKRSRRRRRTVDRFFEDEDSLSGLSMAPRPLEDGTYDDALADLGRLLARNRDNEADGSPVQSSTGMSHRHEDNDPEVDLPGLGRGDASATDAAGTTTAEPAPEVEAGQDATVSAQPERFVILYLKSPAGVAMHGSDLFPALHGIDMTLGAMGIYHDLDDRQQPIFSAANMYEPGTLDIDDPTRFTTHGLALFMCLPGPADERAAFDRMLLKAEQLAGKLGAVLHDEHHQPLTADSVERLRRSFKP